MGESRLVYLVGEPGIGKSSVMAGLVSGATATPGGEGLVRFIDWHRDGELWAREIGARRDAFSGTDALGMAVMPQAVQWIASIPAPLVLGEGDRLGSRKFFEAASDAGYLLRVIALIGRSAAERRSGRGSSQSATWIKGRASKVRRLIAEGWAYPLDADRELDDVVADVRRVAEI